MLVKDTVLHLQRQRKTNRHVIITIEEQISCRKPESRTLLERILYANVGSLLNDVSSLGADH